MTKATPEPETPATPEPETPKGAKGAVMLGNVSHDLVFYAQGQKIDAATAKKLKEAGLANLIG